MKSILLDLVTEAPHSLDLFARRPELAAQPGYMRINGACIAHIMVTPDILQELVAADDPAAPFDEMWHMTKPRDGSTGWILAGIQQVQ